MTKAEFGRRINTSRQNVNTLLRKESMDIQLLQKIGKVLQYDFLALYTFKGHAIPLDGPKQEAGFELVVRVPNIEHGKDLLDLLQHNGYLQ